MLTTTPLFDITKFDYRAIAATHPATCVCGSCEKVRDDAAHRCDGCGRTDCDPTPDFPFCSEPCAELARVRAALRLDPVFYVCRFCRNTVSARAVDILTAVAEVTQPVAVQPHEYEAAFHLYGRDICPTCAPDLA